MKRPVIPNPRSAVRNHNPGVLVWTGLLAFMFAFLAEPLKAEEIDRLLAAVNGKVITEGDLVLARNLNEILSLGRNDGIPSRNAEIERLIDLELMRQELVAFPMATGDQSNIESRLQEIKSAYADAGGLSASLRRLGLSEMELANYVRLQDSILRFVNFRFRPFAAPSEQEVQAYYNDKLLPPVRKANAPIPPLAEVSGKILDILTEEKVNALMNQWIQDIRRHSRIEYFLESADDPWRSK